ncbi:outer membrane efflux protein [Desulfitobacterium sp. LBE]|uniref:TolC family protein n=1 Tax=Desulfitobacterium sp. LBE TaxID=884086 RepID=UPI00119C5546|nr:TolC family protein [Desulfitobacterium sp. LBE]TWH59714.1 outer membrane efflux protein [Desulfitobacterium sp. LBE]
MKKIFSLVLLVAFIVISTIQPARASTDAVLDIERVAIKTVENSQAIKLTGEYVNLMQKAYSGVKSGVDQAKWMVQFVNSYELLESIVLAPKLMEHELNKTVREQAVVTNAMRLSAYQSYINLLKGDYAVKTRSELMSSLYDDYKKIRTQQEQGMAAESEVRLAEIAFEQARYNYLNAQNSMDSSYMTINQMMGEPLSKKYSALKDNNIIPAQKIGSLEDYIAKALTNRVEILNAQGDLDGKKEQLIYGLVKSPIGSEFYEQEQEYEIEKAENQLELSKINVQMNITDLYTGLEAGMKNLDAMRHLAKQAELNYNAALVQYENSMITLPELNNVRIAKAEADINLKNAELDAWFMQMMMGMACDLGFQSANGAA